jgi:hypothetical protein
MEDTTFAIKKECLTLAKDLCQGKASPESVVEGATKLEKFFYAEAPGSSTGTEQPVQKTKQAFE